MIITTLLTFLGECDLNQNVGVDWEQFIGKKPNPSNIINTIRNNLDQLGFIQQVDFTGFSYKNRKFSFSLNITNKDGEEYDVSYN
ncbi:MAG: hypothetical protein ACRC31_03405 [Cetobacterium sp.]